LALRSGDERLVASATPEPQGSQRPTPPTHGGPAQVSERTPAPSSPPDTTASVPADRRPTVRALGRTGTTVSPVADALVRAVASSEIWDARTGADGCARLPEESAGVVSLWVFADGWGASRL